MDFSTLILSDERRATLHRHDEWTRVWWFMEIVNQFNLEDTSQERGGMISANIVGSKIRDSFDVNYSVNINAM